MRITAAPTSYLPPASTVSPRASAAAPAPAASTSASLVGSLTESDKSFLLNSFGMTVTARVDPDSMTFHGTENMSPEQARGASTLASQLMADRQRGAVDGDVSSSYLTGLLSRIGTDPAQAPFADAISKALEHLAGGSTVARVDTRV